MSEFTIYLAYLSSFVANLHRKAPKCCHEIVAFGHLSTRVTTRTTWRRIHSIHVTTTRTRPRLTTRPNGELAFADRWETPRSAGKYVPVFEKV